MTASLVAARRRDLLLAGPLLGLWIVFFAFGCAVIRPWQPEVPLSNDFVSFWTGATLLRDGAGAGLYDTEVQSRFQADLSAWH